MKFKEFIGVILTIGSLIGIVVCAIVSTIFYFQNPDMTDLRRLFEYPEPAIGAVICFITFTIGSILVSNKKY